jgi:hypothetical protein
LTNAEPVWSRNLDKNALITGKPSIKQGLPVEKKTLLTAAFILVLLFSAAAAFFVKSTQANPYIHDSKYAKVSPPTGTQPPAIIIHTPQNGSFYQKNLNLTFDVIISETNGDKSVREVTKLYYKATWEPNEVTISVGFEESTSFSIDLSGVSGGNHSITIYAVGYGYYYADTKVNGIRVTHYINRFEIIGFSTVSFIKDTTPPKISLLHLENETYETPDVPINFTVNEQVSLIRFSLDGQKNATFYGNTSLTGLTSGKHNITLYVWDKAGNLGVSETKYFSVSEPEPEPFPTMLVVASVLTVAIIGEGLLIYFKKRKR